MSKLTRREFVKSSAAATAAAASLVGPSTWAGANDRIRAACVGIRGQGRGHIRGLQNLPGVEVVALCDVDESVLAARLKEFEEQGWNKPKTYTDVRKLLDLSLIHI